LEISLKFASLPVPVQLEITEIHVPILMKIKHNQGTPQRRVQNGESQAEKRAHNGHHHNTVTAPIDGEVQNKEREEEYGDVVMIHDAVPTRPPHKNTVGYLLIRLIYLACNHRIAFNHCICINGLRSPQHVQI